VDSLLEGVHSHQDSILALLANGVDLKVTELGQLALRCALVPDALVAALAGRIGSHDVSVTEWNG
jgi:hypothetical protein